jgi:hypothetical protein
VKCKYFEKYSSQFNYLFIYLFICELTEEPKGHTEIRKHSVLKFHNLFEPFVLDEDKHLIHNLDVPGSNPFSEVAAMASRRERRNS